jgi:hypothetical protein
VPKIVGYARYYIEKIRILYVGSFARWRNFLRRVGTPRLSTLSAHAYSGIDGMGLAFWDGRHRLDQIGWKSVPVAGMGWIEKPERMDSWFSYIP